jgi:hypothetical protein
MWPDVKTHACKSRIQIRERSIQVVERWLLGKNDVITAVTIPPLNMGRAKPRVAADVKEHQGDDDEQGPLHGDANRRGGLTI